MNLHPITWTLFGFAFFGMFITIQLVIPLLLLAAVAALILRGKKFKDFNGFTERRQND